MNYQLFQPHDLLRPYLFGFSSLEIEEDHRMIPIPCIPSGAMLLNFEIGGVMRGGGIPVGPVNLPSSFVCGQITGPHWIMSVDSSVHFNVIFQATGFFRLTGMDAGQFNNGFMSLDLLGEKWHSLGKAVHEANNSEERIRILTDFFLEMVPEDRPSSKHDIPEQVLDIIRQDHRNTIADIADSLGFAERHIRRVFKRQVGMSPKKYQQIMRIHKVINLLRQEPDMSIQDIVAICDFADSAHLSRQFKRFTGRTINDYLKTHPGLREQWVIWD